MNRTGGSTTMVRKPWGGQLDPRAEGGDSGPMALIGPWLRKFCELLLLTTLLAVPLSYHFSLNPGPFQFLNQRFTAGISALFGIPLETAALFFEDEIRPFLTGQMPVLATKFNTWLIVGGLLIVTYSGLRVLEAITRRPIMPPVEATPRFSSRNLHRSIPLVGIAVFLALTLGSLLLWAPEVPPEATLSLRTGGAAFLDAMGGGGFLFSTMAWFQVLFALLFFLVAEDLIRDRTFAMKIFGVLILAAVLNAVVVVLLKVGFSPLMNVWIRFSPGEYRNSLGAFIGHNTGVSSFLMTPLVICTCWLIGVQPRRRPWLRVFLGSLVALFVLVLILCQSRAVIPIVGLAIVAMVVWFYRRSCLVRFSPKFLWLPAALALIVASQFIQSSYNPLYRADMSLTERVSQFRYSHLRTETRLRIFWIAMTELVPARPLIGHGWASFQYVYPKAAGDFFARYPDTELAPTPLRTPQAHNEYLQLLVENGLVGVAVALIPLFFLLRGGYNVMQRTIMPYHITVQIGILLSIGCILLHCAFDFPLRVPPIALTLVVLLAMWSAGDRLWLFPLKPPADEDVEAEGKGVDSDSESVVEPRPAPGVRPWALATGLAVAAVITVVGAAGIGLASGPTQTLATSILRGDAMVDHWYRTRNADALVEALDQAANARRVFWISGEANLLMARVQTERALYLVQQARSEANAGRRDVAMQTISLARTYLEAGTSDIALSLTELRYHLQYVQRAAIHGQLARLSPSQEAAEFRRRATDDLQEAVAMNPGDPYSLLDLIEVLETNPAVNRQMIVAHMRTLNYFHPDFFRETIAARMLDCAAVYDVEEARRVLNTMTAFIEPGFRSTDNVGKGAELAAVSGEILSPRKLRALASNDDLRLAEAHISFLEGNHEAAYEVATRYMSWYDRSLAPRRDVFGREQWAEIEGLALNARILTLQDAIVRVRTPSTIRLLDELDRTGHGAEPTVRALRYLVARFQSPPSASQTAVALEEELRQEARTKPFVARVVADQAEKVLGRHDEALRWMELRRSITEVPLDAVDLTSLARLYRRLEKWDELESVLPQLETVKSSPSIRRFINRKLEQYRADIAAAREANP